MESESWVSRGLALCGLPRGGPDSRALRSIPGKANAEIQGIVLSLGNQMIRAQWSVAEGKLTAPELVICTTGAQASLPSDPFSFTFKDGTTVHASAMVMIGSPQVDDLPSNSGSSRTADHFAGKAISLRLQCPGKDSAEKRDATRSTKRISVVWRAVLRDDSNYIREDISLSAPDRDQPIAEVYLFNGNLTGASVVGTVKGSPLTARRFVSRFRRPPGSVPCDKHGNLHDETRTFPEEGADRRVFTHHRSLASRPNGAADF